MQGVNRATGDWSMWLGLPGHWRLSWCTGAKIISIKWSWNSGDSGDRISRWVCDGTFCFGSCSHFCVHCMVLFFAPTIACWYLLLVCRVETWCNGYEIVHRLFFYLILFDFIFAWSCSILLDLAWFCLILSEILSCTLVYVLDVYWLSRHE